MEAIKNEKWAIINPTPGDFLSKKIIEQGLTELGRNIDKGF